MITLIPSWASHYEEFWQAIQKRNLWFIKLRYGAVIMLLAFLSGSHFLFNFKFSSVQLKAILIITTSIFVYNLLLSAIKKIKVNIPGKINPLHFSLIQMILDLTALWLLVYYTGGIETPLYLLFIFHMIIGGLILPGTIMYIVAGWYVAGFIILVFAEYSGIIIHHPIHGFLDSPFYNNANYVFSFSLSFVFVMFMSVILANRIAAQLYKMEQNLIESLNKLESAEIEKQKYIIGVAHEIKTPLAALHSYLDVILDKYLGPVNPQIEEKLRRAKIRSEEAMELVNDVLKISRIKLLNELKKEGVKIDVLLKDILEKYSQLIQTKGIALGFVDNRKDKTIIQGDIFWLEIAFSNLINNAIKYVCAQGLIEIIINNINDGILIEISDNGIGIPPEEQEKIFKEFYRASNIRQIKTEGSGLGLSIVKQIVEKHNGSIRLLSPSEKSYTDHPGTTVYVTIPYN